MMFLVVRATETMKGKGPESHVLATEAFQLKEETTLCARLDERMIRKRGMCDSRSEWGESDSFLLEQMKCSEKLTIC
jgi:hypothetical protein